LVLSALRCRRTRKVRAKPNASSELLGFIRRKLPASAQPTGSGGVPFHASMTT
jgi:hypothetical protein